MGSFGIYSLLPQSSVWPRGRGLGGSGELNYMVHFPGLCSDFARWEAAGAQGWSCDKLRTIIARMTCERHSNWVPPRRCSYLPYDILFQGNITHLLIYII
jgi:choline dehydrogenase-like flavoprotein